MCILTCHISVICLWWFSWRSLWSDSKQNLNSFATHAQRRQHEGITLFRHCIWHKHKQSHSPPQRREGCSKEIHLRISCVTYTIPTSNTTSKSYDENGWPDKSRARIHRFQASPICRQCIHHLSWQISLHWYKHYAINMRHHLQSSDHGRGDVDMTSSAR